MLLRTQSTRFVAVLAAVASLACVLAVSQPSRGEPPTISRESARAGTTRTPSSAATPPRPLSDRETSLAGEDHPVRRMIERLLPDASAEERDIWFDELRELPAASVEDLLRFRRQVGGSPSSAITPLSPPPLTIPLPPVSPRAGSNLSAETRLALERRCAVHRHNLLNASTPGFRRLIPLFAAGSLTFPDSATSELAETGGCRWVGVRLDSRVFPFERTSRPLDVAIEGPGWFVVKDGEEQAYTRNGSFSFNDQRQLGLETPLGFRPVEPAIIVTDPSSLVIVEGDGQVYRFAEKTGRDRSPLGTLQVVQFRDESALRPRPDGLYAPTIRSGAAFLGVGADSIQSGALESSNVNVDHEQAALHRVEHWLNAAPPHANSSTAP